MATEGPTTEIETEELFVFEDAVEVDACQLCAKIFRLLLLLPLLLVNVEVEVDAVLVVVAVSTLLVLSSLLPFRARILLSLVVLLLLLSLLLPRRRRHRLFFSSCCCSDSYAGIASALARPPLLRFVNIAIVRFYLFYGGGGMLSLFKIGRTIVTTMQIAKANGLH